MTAYYHVVVGLADPNHLLFLGLGTPKGAMIRNFNIMSVLGGTKACLGEVRFQQFHAAAFTSTIFHIVSFINFHMLIG